MLKVAHFFNNIDGLNVTDSPFYIKDGQATGGFNYDYVRTGGVQKVTGVSAINPVADTQLKTLGWAVHETSAGAKTVLRAAGTKIQTVDTDTGSLVNQTTTGASATEDVLDASSEQTLISASFNNGISDLVWMAGAGTTLPVGYNGTNLVINGVASPTGTFTAVNQGSATGGTWGAATGVYYYALVLRKTSTQALSNAALDQMVTIVTSTDSVLLTFPTGIDTALYDQWYVYRSSVGGVSAFTAGSLVAQVSTSLPTFVDTNITLASSQVVPRSGNGLLDNSTLPAGTYNSMVAFKRRLVVASGNALYISDLNKSESWPAGLKVVLPSGGPVTGLGIVGYNANDGVSDEYLVVFKERETWIITGTVAYQADTGLYDFELKFVDGVGCISQALAVRTNGYLCWIDYRGVYMWSGQGKPIYCSRPIESIFGPDGNLDKTKLRMGWGAYFRKKNQIIWGLSDRTYGENKILLKLDLRLSSPKTSELVGTNQVISEGVFIMDKTGKALYSALSTLPTNNEELLIVGDASGFIYKAYSSASNDGAGIEFSYQTKALDLDSPTIDKQYSKVVVYIDQSVDKQLILNYWAGYRVFDSERSQIDQPMSKDGGLTGSLWDLAVWDVSFWDEYQSQAIPLVFNLSSDENNNQGDSIMLKFIQNDATAPLIIHGFSIYYEEIGLRK